MLWNFVLSFLEGDPDKKSDIYSANLKFMIKLKFLLSGLVLTCLFAACNQSDNSAKSPQKDSVATISSVAPQIKDKPTNVVYIHYIHLKDALVASNISDAQAAAKELSAALAKIDGCENTSMLAAKISNTSDIKVQRFNFTALSSDIIAMLKNTEMTSGQMYVQYCPMANDGDGGYWLSSEKEIKNPYYGDEMMNCGEIKDTIRTK